MNRLSIICFSVAALAFVGGPAARDACEADLSEPILVAQYQGEPQDANQQAHHFVRLIRAGNGNLVALYRLRPDEPLPSGVVVADYLRQTDLPIGGRN